MSGIAVAEIIHPVVTVIHMYNMFILFIRAKTAKFSIQCQNLSSKDNKPRKIILKYRDIAFWHKTCDNYNQEVRMVALTDNEILEELEKLGIISSAELIDYCSEYLSYFTCEYTDRFNSKQ